MFVKIYQYHIPKEKVANYLAIQEKASAIYSQYVNFHTVYLNSKEDETKWMEVTSYHDEIEYNKAMSLMNEQKEIQDLYDAFNSVLSSDKSEILEEGFIKWKEHHSFFERNL